VAAIVARDRPRIVESGSDTTLIRQLPGGPGHTGVPMATADKRKQSLYFPEEMLAEIQAEAARLDRSLSWIVQRAWKFARAKLEAVPSTNDDPDSLPDRNS